MMRKAGIAVVLLLILAGVNYSVWRIEQVLAHGQELVLELAPVDPRSLMQGDYMALRFALGDDIRRAGKADTVSAYMGRVVVQADEQGVARFVALDTGQPLAPGQQHLQYRWRGNQVQIATNAFFFQEGTGQQYEAARYGLFRLGVDGQPYLTRLLDEHLNKIGTESQP